MIELAVVGEQQQTFGVLVETSDGEHFEMFPYFRDEIDDNGIVFVLDGAQISGGFSRCRPR